MTFKYKYDKILKLQYDKCIAQETSKIIEMNKQEVIDLMNGSRSEDEWNTNCNTVKKACGGYPEFWHEAIVDSGVASQVAKNFGGTADIGVTSFSSRDIKSWDFPSSDGRPMGMPRLQPGEQLVGVWDQGLGEKETVCTTLVDMQSLYDSYARGMALTLRWCAKTQTRTVISAPVAAQ